MRSLTSAALAKAALAVSVCLGTLTLVPSAHGVVVVQDTFSGPDGTLFAKDDALTTPIAGLPPEINLPGGVWTKTTGWNWGPPNINGGKGYAGENGTGVAISLAGYTPTTISAKLATYNGDLAIGKSALGFFSQLSAPDTGEGGALNYFTGIAMVEGGTPTQKHWDDVLQQDVIDAPAVPGNGLLQLYVNGTAVGSPVDVGFIVNKDTLYTLSYDISGGSLSNVVFEGTPVTGLTSDAFTPANTPYAAFVVSGGHSARGYMDDFTVNGVAVPEPASMALLGLAGAGVLLRRKH